MPNAQVVADIFHVMAIINQELDRQRKAKTSDNSCFKNSKISIKKS